VLSLFLLSPKLKPVLWQATAFTVAHSVTLGLAMYHIITPRAGNNRAADRLVDFICCA
jgi:hypothetical protein